MNGRDLLEAMSFLDEELVAASDTAPGVIPWKRILTLAACLCIVLLGAFSLTRISPREQIKEASADSFSLTEAASQMDAGQPETGRAEDASEEASLLDCSEEEDTEVLPLFWQEANIVSISAEISAIEINFFIYDHSFRCPYFQFGHHTFRRCPSDR